MFGVVFLILYFVTLSNGGRAGVQHCTTENFGSLYDSETGSVDSSYNGVLVQDEAFTFSCCGVIKSIQNKNSGKLTVQIWRQNFVKEYSDAKFTLYNDMTYTIIANVTTIQDGEMISFQEGDLFGWNVSSGNFIEEISDSNYNWLNRIPINNSQSFNHGDTYDWYNSANFRATARRKYRIQVTTQASTAPFFTNLPAYLEFSDTETMSSGITVYNVLYDDIDLGDSSTLSVSFSHKQEDKFKLDTTIVSTKTNLDPDTYILSFEVGEDHCGLSSTSTLTITVKNSVPSITNLPSWVSVHEDDVHEKLLYTVTMSDKTKQRMWCKGNWSIGPLTNLKTQYPFIVRMISSDGGNSSAGVYLIEQPHLDYSIADHFKLVVNCYDTYGDTATGTLYVNVIENQKPIFTNLGNIIEIDATAAFTGTTVFTVSTSDADNDQIRYSFVCVPAVDCPFYLYNSGEVVVTKNLLMWTTPTYTLTVSATDLRASNVPKDLVIHITNTNNKPVFATLTATITVPENSALGKSLFQASATDIDSDTITYYMSIDKPEGYGLFEMSNAGLVSTHTVYNIDYDMLTIKTYVMTIYAHDGKAMVDCSITLTVTNVNEAPVFVSPEYMITEDEEAPTNIVLAISAIDPDIPDPLNYIMDCGAYNSYFALVSTTLTHPQPYDLDNSSLDLPTLVTCIVNVLDTQNSNDTTTLYINIKYKNDNSPVFSPTTGSTVDVRTDTPMGQSIIQLTVTDADKVVGGTIQYTIADPAFIVDENGLVRAKANMVSQTGSRLVNVIASDGSNSVTASVTVTFIDASVVVNATTDRAWEYIEDPRNVTWLTMSSITVATCVFVIFCIIIRCCMARKMPSFKIKWPKFEKKQKRQLDSKRRKMPLFSKQQTPVYRHVHAHEILRNSPRIVTPELVADNFSIRPDSNMTGRVTVTDVHVSDNERDNWMDGETLAVSAAPMRSMTNAKTTDWEYLHRGHNKSSNSAHSGDAILSTYVKSKASQIRQQTSKPMSVSVSPVQWNKTGDDDDFRSERLSIASPMSVMSEDLQQA